MVTVSAGERGGKGRDGKREDGLIFGSAVATRFGLIREISLPCGLGE